MFVLLWLLILLMMMMMMKSDAAFIETVRALSGEAVLLSSQLPGALEGRQDVRWTHPHLLLSLQNKVTTCHHGRCSLQSDGSLSFSRVTPADAGNYSLEVFAANGTRLLQRHFMLTVGDISSSSVLVPVLISCFLFLLFFIIFFIVKRRRSQSTRNTGQLEENVYVEMKSHHGNKMKDKEEKPCYVPCHPVVSTETPITEPRSVDKEDIYV